MHLICIKNGAEAQACAFLTHQALRVKFRSALAHFERDSTYAKLFQQDAPTRAERVGTTRRHSVAGIVLQKSYETYEVDSEYQVACIGRLSSCTASTSAETDSGGVNCEMPCPKLNT